MFQRIIFIALFTIPCYLNAQFGFQRIDTIDVYELAVFQKHAWAGGMDYCQFSNIDLNFDGTEDLFVFDRVNNKVLTFIQNGAPGSTDFVYAPQYESKFPQYNNTYNQLEDSLYLFNWVLLVDYNCDGKKDIFAHRAGGIKVFKNTGNITDGLSFEVVSGRIKSTQYGNPLYYLYVSGADLPGIMDADGDGDIDIITFGQSGQTLWYHKNMSMETYGVCDSLFFEMKNECWGRFTENSTTNSVTLWDTLNPPCDDSPWNLEDVLPYGNDERHDGSTVLPLDLNANGVTDLVIGDIAFDNLVMLMNSGIAPNLNSGMSSYDVNFPSNSIPVHVTVFPGAYHVDVNNDGKRDLVVTPSSTVGSENRTSAWLYINTGSDLAPIFIYQSDDFLQAEMIDVGSRALPVFFDHSGDGLKDLLVSCNGHFDPLTGNQICTIYYYENTGTLSIPEYTLVTEDYMNISQMGIGYSLYFYPTFGDLDNDGDEDMVLGEYSGYCYYFENTGGAGNPAIFNTYIILNNYMGVGFPLVEPGTAGIFVTPTLVDLERDGDLDLVVGRRNGKLNYYENIGTASAFSFLYLTNFLGGVDVSEWWSTEGYAVPQFLDIDGEYKLIVGSKTGYLHYYDDIETNISGSFTAIDSTVDNILTGTYSAPTIFDINNDNRLEMVLGNARGGVALYKSAQIGNINFSELKSDRKINVYPNPAYSNFIIDLSVLNQSEMELCLVTITDLSGRILFKSKPTSQKMEIDSQKWSDGTYIIQVSTEDYSWIEKLIVN